MIAAVDRLGAGLLELHVRPEPQVTREQMFLIGQAFDQMLTALEKIGHLPRPATRPPGPP